MGGAGSKGLLPTFHGLHAENSHQDLQVGGRDDREGQEQREDTADIDHGLIDGGVSTGQLEHSGDLTEKVVDLLGATVGETQGEDSLDQPVYQAKEPGPSHHEPELMTTEYLNGLLMAT